MLNYEIMKKVLYTKDEVAGLIREGRNLLLAGDEELLKELPDGKWIGGSITYFMAEKGGSFSKDYILVNEIPSFIKKVECKSYDIATIKNIYKDGFDQGFSVVIIPSSSEVHLSFAIHAPDYKGFANVPLIGWIAGVTLADLGTKTAKTFIGSGKSICD